MGRGAWWASLWGHQKSDGTEHSCTRAMNILIRTPCLFTFRKHLFIQLYNQGCTSALLVGDLFYSLYLNYK